MQIPKRLQEIVYTEQGRTIIDFSIMAFVAIIIFRNFIFSGGWPGGGDTLGWVTREYLYGQDFRWLNLWRPHSFGFVEGINSIDFFLMLIHSVCQSGAVTAKAFMFFTFLAAGFSMYGFIYHYTRNNLAALSASLVYMLNHWFFTQFTEGHLGLLFGYAIAPLLFLLLSRALKHGRLKDLTLFAVALAICLTGFNPLSVVIYMLFLALFTVFYLVIPQSSFHFWNRTKRVLKVLAFSGVTFLFLSAFYILPFVNNARAPFYSTEFSYDLEETVGLSYENTFDAFVLRGSEQWGYFYIIDVTSEVSLQIIPVSVIFAAIFLMAYSTVFVKTDNYTIFFLVTCLISIFLAKGPNPPYGNIFVWSWFNIPHFAVFRAASRFVMITAFSHAFFISVLVSILTGYISKTRSSQAKETHLEINARTSAPKGVVEKQVFSFNFINKALKRIKTFSYYFSTLLLIIILSIGFLTGWFFLQNGLQVYKPSEMLITPYEWIANQPQEFKIVTVARSPSEWELAPNALMDFGSGGMLTNIGWGHDLGFDSAFLHDKPVLQDGGHTFKSRKFVSYLRFGVGRNELSDQLVKVLGTFDYRYVVIPEYASENVRSFFLNQEGTEVVYNQSGSIILGNSFYNSRISSSTASVLVVGGIKSFFTTSKIESLNLNQSALVFADQLEDQKPVLDRSGAILFDDSDLLDLVMSSSEDMNVILAEQYALPSRNYSAYWGKAAPWEDFGVLALGRYTLTTAGNNRVAIPFEVGEDGDYEVMIRLGFCNDRGNLAVYVDSIPIKSVCPSTDARTVLKWIKIGSLSLEKGKHELSLTNDGTGWNDIDAIAVVKSSTLETQIQEVLNQIQNYPGRIVHILTAHHTFAHQIPSGWHITTVPYQGYVLESDSPSTFLAANTTILREGRYMFAIRLAQGPNQGSPQLQVDNTTVTLQLLNSSEDTEWYGTESICLNASNHLIEIGGSGKIAFDQLLIYSLEDEEHIVILDNFSLHATELGRNISPEGISSASSVGVWDTISLDANGAKDGHPNTRWASKPHDPLPQWLQIEWETPQELTGAHIHFEQAYAENYVIQTWNGTDWIDQISVIGNNQLNRTHAFEEPVKTDKLRVLVTSVTKLYDLVSIWELEAYATPTVSKKVFIPQDGYYRIGFQIASGPNYGTLNLTINNTPTTILCNSPTTESRLYEDGPIYFKAGEQNVTVSATGKVNFDEMTLTLSDEGDFGFLDDLFKAKSGPNVSYEIVNPCKYEAHIEDSDEPFLLIFSESYHPMWKAYIDGEETSPIPTYSLVNGFYINKTGNFNVTIYFTGQTYADVGLQISMITLIFVVVILIIPSERLEHLGSYINRKIRREKTNPSVTSNRSRESPFRIAILHHALGRFGGAEKTAILHGIYMKKLGFETELFYNGPLHPDWKKRARSNMVLNTLPFGFPPSFKGFRDIEKLLLHLKSFDVVLVHHHICPFLAYYLTLFLKNKLVWYSGEPLRALWENQLTGITSKELSSTIRPTSKECYGKSFTSLFLSNILYGFSINFLRAIDKKTAKRYAHIIVNSNYTRKVIKTLYTLKHQITVAYPGIEIGEQNRNCGDYRLNKYILAIGAMIQMKNYINLLKAYHQLPPNYRSAVKLVIVGDGPLKEKVQSLAKDLGLSNLIFQSNINEEELISHYKNCKFIVHVALHEPFGLVPIEAALFGKPSIVSNQGGTKEFIRHGENGFLVNPYDPTEVAKYMKCLIEDEKLAAEMGSTAKERAVKEFTIEKSTEQIMEALKQLN